MALPSSGWAKLFTRMNEWMPARPSPGRLKPLVLQAKEGLALINGTQVMTAVGALALHKAGISTEASAWLLL
jgi:histidine ammonia-lyase